MSAEASRHPFHLERLIEYSQALVSALPEATVLVVDGAGTVRVAEGKLLERNGHPAGSLSGRRLEDILPPSERERLIAHYRAALAGETQNFDYRTIGDRRLCWIQVTPIYFGEPVPAGIIGVIQDLTLRHSLTAELHSERERRQAAEKLAGLGYWEVDVASGQVVLSAGSRRLLGREEPELRPRWSGCDSSASTWPRATTSGGPPRSRCRWPRLRPGGGSRPLLRPPGGR